MISPTGYWSDDEAKFHIGSEELAVFLAGYLDKDEYVIDFGCGDGFYLSYLQSQGFEKTIGIDGMEIYTASIPIQEMDISQPIFLDQKGQVISLEVGEHIPKQFEENYIDNITHHCTSKLILSWAIKGQPGIGHINNQNNDYVIREIEERGFRYDEGLSKEIRKSIEEDTYWFRNTLMIFNKI